MNEFDVIGTLTTAIRMLRRDDTPARDEIADDMDKIVGMLKEPVAYLATHPSDDREDHLCDVDYYQDAKHHDISVGWKFIPLFSLEEKS